MQSTLNHIFCTLCLKSKASEQEAWNLFIYDVLPHFFFFQIKKVSEASRFLLQEIKDYL